MKFVIRDDDTSFFTNQNDLEKAYDFVSSGCISLSVVPNTVCKHKDIVYPYGENIADGYYDISLNEELVEYLKEGKKRGKYDILLHGYSHEYKKIRDKWYSELMWKDEARLREELGEAKGRLERLFDCDISVLVAPNNHIGKVGIKVAEELNMNFSGIIQFFDRKMSIKYMKNFILRWFYRLTKKIQYPGVLDYGGHKELAAYGLDGIERLKFEYEQCKKKNAPFVIYTHYWHVNTNSKIKETLKAIYDYAINDGAELVGLSDCF